MAKSLTRDEVRLYNYAYSDYSKAKKMIMQDDSRILMNKEHLNLEYNDSDSPLSQIIYTDDEIRTDMQKHTKVRYRQSMKPTTGKGRESI